MSNHEGFDSASSRPNEEAVPQRYLGYIVDRERTDLYSGLDLSHEGPITHTPEELVDDWFNVFGNYKKYGEATISSMIEEFEEIGDGRLRLPDRGNNFVGWQKDLFAEFGALLRARFMRETGSSSR